MTDKKPADGLKINIGDLSGSIPPGKEKLPPGFAPDPPEIEPAADPPGNVQKVDPDPTPGEDPKLYEMTPEGVRMITRTPFSAVATLTGFKGYKLTQEEVDLLSPKVAFCIKEFIPGKDLKWYAVISLGIDLSAIVIKKTDELIKDKREKKKPPQDQRPGSDSEN